MQAIRTIQDEHRSLAAILHGMLHLVHAIRDRGVRPDFNVLGAMIYYIDAFPERFHHPKEDEYLFRFLRIRHPDARPLLDRLKSEHRAGRRRSGRSSRRWRATSREATRNFPASWPRSRPTRNSTGST